MQLARIDELYPTQICVGFQAAKNKQKRLENKRNQELIEYLESHPIPVVKGYESRYYLIDHHHLLVALDEMKIKKVYIKEVLDLSHLDHDAFWNEMKVRKYIWPFDQHGRELSLMEFVAKLPRTIDELNDDPYRTLAGMLKDNNAYTKDWTPFSEFHWANHLRKLIPLYGGKVTDMDVKTATVLAKSQACSHLPGWVRGAIPAPTK